MRPPSPPLAFLTALAGIAGVLIVFMLVRAALGLDI